MTTTVGLYVDGKNESGETGSYPVTNPANPSETVLEAPWASLAQVDQAVVAARNAFSPWREMNFEERKACIGEAAAFAVALGESEGWPSMLTKEHGKILDEATFDIATLGIMTTAFGDLMCQALAPEVIATGLPRTEVVREPHGVVVALLPFNWPVAVLGNKLLPALLAGNTVVIKAPPTCPATVLKAVSAFGSKLPPGVVNSLNGPAGDVGAALASHSDIDLISFTGGPSTGQAVMGEAAKRTVPVVLELGGNDPAILAPDVDIDEALVNKLFEAAFVTSGQVCMAVKRLFVPQRKVDEVRDALCERLTKEVVGSGLRKEVTMGPLHHKAALDRLESMLASALAHGARVDRPAVMVEEDVANGGYFASPAIVSNVAIDEPIVFEEQFAPGLPVIGYRSLENAIDAANSTTYGLCASIWSNDLDLAASIARKLDAGTVFVNTHGMVSMDYRAPMGGWKQSGFGSELGIEGMRAFSRPKTVLTHALR